MIIVCATDDNFVQHCSIMLVSLLINNKDVHIYILTEGLRPENEKIIQDEVTQYNGVVDFCLVDSSIVEKFPMPALSGLSHISRATYYRLLISDILPMDVHKAIYLDCDMIINDDITDLWNTDLNGYAMGAVPQIGYGFEAIRLGYPIEYGYFNAGMNVINLDYFRKNNVSQQLLEYIETNFSKIKYHDQDALNGTLYNKTKHLLPQWNMTSAVYVYQLNRRGDRIDGKLINDYKDEKQNAFSHLSHPTILHYVSKPKPWQEDCIHPLCQLYYDYAKKTIHYADLKMPSPFHRQIMVVKAKIFDRISAIKQAIKKNDKTRY